MGRRTVLALALGAALLGAPPAASAESGKAVAIDRTPEFVQRVNGAIAHGVAWLSAANAPPAAVVEYPSYRYGLEALTYHTLRVCGVPREDPVADRVWQAVRRSWAANGGRTGLQTYSAGLLLMALAERSEPVARPTDDHDRLLDPADRAWAEEIVRWIVQAQNGDGTWTYGSTGGRRGANLHDHSNTQYALLGLKAAARCGVNVDPRVWRSSLRHFLDSQESSGPQVARFDPGGQKKGSTFALPAKDRARGWGYVGHDTAYGSMTAGGVGSVVICRSELMGTPAMTKSLEAESDTSLRDGLAWLGRNFNVRTNPGPAGTMAGAGWHHYWLYAAERAGVLSGTDWMGDRDWYGEGAEFLCDTQAADGGWFAAVAALPPLPARAGRGLPPVVAPAAVAPSPQSVLDTCFALLFLKKGTLPVRRGALTQAADDSDIRFDAAATLSARDLDDLLDLVLSRWRRSTDEDVQRRLFDGATSVGPRIVEPLLVRMDSTDADVRASAHALLRRATGEEHAYDARAEASGREAALLRWQGWWLGASKTLHYDGAAKRLVR